MINCSSSPFTHLHLMISVFANVSEILQFGLSGTRHYAQWLDFFLHLRMLKHTRPMKSSCSAAGTSICIVVHCPVVIFEEQDCFPNMMLIRWQSLVAWLVYWPNCQKKPDYL